MFAVVAMEMFGLSATQNGYLMSYIGMLSMLVQGVGMGLLNRRFSELQLIQGGVFVLIWAYLALVSACHSFAVGFAPLCLARSSSGGGAGHQIYVANILRVRIIKTLCKFTSQVSSRTCMF